MNFFLKDFSDRHISITNHFIKHGFGSNMPILTHFSILKPIDRCIILEKLFEKKVRNIHLYDKMVLAYVKIGRPDLGKLVVEFARQIGESEFNCWGIEQKLDLGIPREISDEQRLMQIGNDLKKTNASLEIEFLNLLIEFIGKANIFSYSNLDYYVINDKEFNHLITGAVVKIWEEEVPLSTMTFSPLSNFSKKTGKYHFAIISDVTEKLVGIGENNKMFYRIPWELKREEDYNGKKFIILCGWSDSMTGGNRQFEDYEIGIEKIFFANFIARLMSEDSNLFSTSQMQNIVGLEGFRFEGKKIII